MSESLQGGGARLLFKKDTVGVHSGRAEPCQKHKGGPLRGPGNGGLRFSL